MKSNKGYTLIEILVVMGLMTIAFSFVVINTANKDSASLSSSQRILSAVAQGARGQAIMKQSPSRLIIYADKSNNSDPDKYLRYFGIIFQDPKHPRKWLAGTEGIYLPKGIFFMPELTQIVNGNREGLSKMYINYPRIKSQTDQIGYGEEYYYYEFNENGTVGSNFVNSWLRFGAGKLSPSANKTTNISFDNPGQEGMKSGLIFRKAGSTTLITDSGQIDRMAQKNIR